ncbi:MAG: FtsX-like permease family protein [Bacteroidota bacterium]
MSSINPPKFWQCFLRWFCDSELYEEISGDLNEAFGERLANQGKYYARKKYRLDVIKFFKPYAWKKLHINRQHSPLLKNYFKIGIRNILKHRGYSFLNATGLVIGMTCVFLSLLYLRNELRYDQFHSDSENIYRVQRVFRSQNYAIMPFIDWWSTTAEDQLNYLNELKSNPQIVNAVQFNTTNSPTSISQFYIQKSDGERLVENNILWTNSGSEYFVMFDWPFIVGSPEQALNSTHSMVLTESAAIKYFGVDWRNDLEFLDKYLIIDSVHYAITGVIPNVPQYSHVDFDLIVNKPKIPSWGNYTYIKKAPDMTEAELLEAASNAYFRFKPAAKEDPLEKGLLVKPLASIYMTSKALYELKTPGDPRYLWIFGIIGVIILVVTVTNYFNLSIALYVGRQREIGVRKVLGAIKGKTMTQFLFETLMFTFFCLPVSLFILQLILPLFNTIMEVQLGNEMLSKPLLIAFALGLTILIGGISGLYPSLVLSRKNVLELFRSKISNAKMGLGLRRMLVGFQFLLLIGLGTATYFINQQLNFIQTTDLGFNQEGVISINVSSADSYVKMKNVLANHPKILSMGSGGMPGNEMANTLTYKMLQASENDVNDNGTHIIIDAGSLEVLGIDHPALEELKRGKSSVFLINETASTILAASLDKKPDMLVGEVFQMEPEYDNEEDGTMGFHYTIDGILEDYHYFTLKEQVNPMFIEVHAEPRWTYEMLFRLSTEDMFSTIDVIEKEYEKWHPKKPIKIEFLEQRLALLYKNERQIAGLTMGLSGVAIVLSLLGLVGLVSFITKTKEREIGVRKVFGAGVKQILVLLNREFLILVILATLLAAPLSYWAVTNWLTAFAYRIVPDLYVYLLAGIICLGIVATTVSLQSYRAALKSPAHSLKNEQ